MKYPSRKWSHEVTCEIWKQHVKPRIHLWSLEAKCVVSKPHVCEVLKPYVKSGSHMWSVEITCEAFRSHTKSGSHVWNTETTCEVLKPHEISTHVWSTHSVLELLSGHVGLWNHVPGRHVLSRALCRALLYHPGIWQAPRQQTKIREFPDQAKVRKKIKNFTFRSEKCKSGKGILDLMQAMNLIKDYKTDCTARVFSVIIYSSMKLHGTGLDMLYIPSDR